MTAPRITPDHPAVIRDSQGNPLPPIPDPNGGELLVCWLDLLPEGAEYKYDPAEDRWRGRGDRVHWSVLVKLVQPTIEVDEADLRAVLSPFTDVDPWQVQARARLRAALEAQADRSPKSDPDYMTPERSAMVDRAEAKQGER